MKKKPKLIENIAALGSIQLLNYGLPLVTIPYITRKLGVEAWGQLAIAQIILGYFSTIPNWGFHWTGTQKIARARESKENLSKTFLNIWAAQWLLATTSVALLLTLTLHTSYFRNNWQYYAAGAIGIYCNILVPNWLASGLEQMKKIAEIQLISRSTTIMPIFIFINSPEDAPKILIINAVGTVIAGALTLRWINKKKLITWRKPDWSGAIKEIQEGNTLFRSTLWITMYTTLTPTLLGVISGATASGHFAVADRARNLVQAGLTPISQAIFPRLNHLFNTDQNSALHLLKKSSKYALTIASIASLALWTLSEPIILVIAGEQYNDSIPILRWLSPIPFIASLSSIASTQILLPKNKKNEFNNILKIGAIVSALMIYPMITKHGAIGAAQTILIAETIVCLGMIYYALETLKSEKKK